MGLQIHLVLDPLRLTIEARVSRLQSKSLGRRNVRCECMDLSVVNQYVPALTIAMKSHGIVDRIESHRNRRRIANRDLLFGYARVLSQGNMVTVHFEDDCECLGDSLGRVVVETGNEGDSVGLFLRGSVAL